jgi:hypothetical protein
MTDERKLDRLTAYAVRDVLGVPRTTVMSSQIVGAAVE